MKRFLSILLILAIATSGSAQNLPDLGESAQAGFSAQNERKLGEMIMRELRRDPAFLDDPEAQAFVETIGYKLVTAAGETRQAFDFFVIRDASINAFAMPGGFVGVHTGLVLAAQSEAELASVLGHEIAHVTQRHIARQLDKQSQMQMAAIAGLIIALLAARSNPDISSAAIATTQAGAIQSALNYSRDLEREADRLGFQYLDAANYDVNGMVGFFERLQRATRLQEYNAPAYLRTHPLTTERIADMQNRAAGARYRQQPDSLDFHLVRAKLRALQGSPREAITSFENQLSDKRFVAEGPTRYGLAFSLYRARELGRAESELAVVRKLGTHHSMIETLDASIKLAKGSVDAAVDVLARTMKATGGRFPVAYGYIEALQAAGKHGESLGVLEDLIKQRPRDARSHGLQAKSYAALGRRALQHRSQSEVYYLQGALPAAIEQLQLAQAAGDGDFYLLSSVDSKLRALKAEYTEERKQQRRN
ncbi:MAG: M48 family metalloprotease [Burkholderiales bacterium]